MASPPDRPAARSNLGGALVAMLAIVTGVTLSPAPSRAQDFTIKFATLTINDVQHEYIKMYKAELEKATNNRIKVDVYPAGQLGAAPRQSEGLRLVTLEAAPRGGGVVQGAGPRIHGTATAGLFKYLNHARRGGLR